MGRWVFSSELSSSESAGHTVYDPTKSNQAQELQGYTWNITYGDGSFASGNVYQDTVTIDNVTVGAQSVELAEQVSAQFQQDTDLDGVLGLAFSNINTGKRRPSLSILIGLNSFTVKPHAQLTFLDTAIQKGRLPEQLFTVDLKKDAPGTYDFGYIDSSKFLGSITYTSVDSSNGFWNVSSTGFGIGNESFQSIPFAGIVDTGTSLLVLADDFVRTYWSGVSGATYDAGQGGYTFPCDATLPSVEIGIENYMASVPGNYLNFAPIDNTSK